MTSQIIYHDFQKKNSIPAAPRQEMTQVLTAQVLAKGRRLLRLNHGLNVVCVALCGACIGASLLILTALFAG